MKFHLDVSMDDDAMANDAHGELARIFAELANHVVDDCRPGNVWPIVDSNGNTIGRAKVTR